MRPLPRREALPAAAAAAVLPLQSLAAQPATPAVVKGRLKQSVSRWCYGKIPMPEFCTAVKAMGLTAIDLLEEPDWAVVRDHGLICSMGYAGGGKIPDGLNVRANHDAIVKNFEEKIPSVAKRKLANVITFVGIGREGVSDAEAIANGVEGLNLVKKIGE